MLLMLYIYINNNAIMSKQEKLSSPPPVVQDCSGPTQMRPHSPPSNVKPPNAGVTVTESVMISTPSQMTNSPVKHMALNVRTQGQKSLRLAWAKSSIFRNTLQVPQGGSPLSVYPGIITISNLSKKIIESCMLALLCNAHNCRL